MKLLEFQAHNILKLRDVNFSLEGRHLFLVGGRNDQGKTSALTAMRMALCGRSGADYPEVALREGEDEGWVRLHLAEKDAAPDDPMSKLNVELYMKRRRGGQVVEKFRILDSQGNEAPCPRALLDRLYEMRGFDPLAFERLARREKRELLCKLVGLDFAAEKKERDKLYKDREGVNRDLKTAKVRYAAMPVHMTAPEEEMPVGELLAELDAAVALCDQNRREREYLDQSRRNLSGKAERLERLKAELAEAQKDVDLLDQTVKKQEERAERLKDPDANAIRKYIQESDDMNRRVRENKQRKRAKEELDVLEKQSADLTEKMEVIERAQKKALEEAQWPIAGLSIDEDGVLYNGLPLEQQATSTRTIVSTKIGMALRPGLRLMICQGGNDLGNEAMEALQQTLEGGDFQMILEVVTRSEQDESRCGVVIEDGSARVIDGNGDSVQAIA